MGNESVFYFLWVHVIGRFSCCGVVCCYGVSGTLFCHLSCQAEMMMMMMMRGKVMLSVEATSKTLFLH
jgi:hypothetical protein